jgi:hypothetical protein
MSTTDPFSRADRAQVELGDDPKPTSSSKINLGSGRSRELNFIHTPDELPETIQSPKYAIGDHCRWVPMNTTDWGTIVGQVLTPAQTPSSQWVWLYLVLLASDSPSRQWVTTDWAEEDDLERFHPPA